MALSKEFILTLKQIKGFGTKSILAVADTVNCKIDSIDDLCNFWETLSGKKFAAVSQDELRYYHAKALQLLAYCEGKGIGVISYFDSDFPQMLRNCTSEEGKQDPPLILFYRGNLKALEKPGIAVIGTREPTANGVAAGLHFSKELAMRGFNIVSGLALGCDTTGHRGALDAGGTTTAFLAHGLDWELIYPKENLELAKEIVEKGGLLLSEYAPGTQGNRYFFVARDRLQAGLSYATVVVQTGVHGGTMHAVNATINSNKPLFAVEYKKDSDLSNRQVQGNLMLINSGSAIPLRSSEIEAAVQIVNAKIGKPELPVQLSLF